MDAARLIFVREDGRAYTTNQIQKAFAAARRRAGISDLRFHDLRATCISNWAKQGVGVEIAMDASGHKSYQMHMWYTRSLREGVGRAFGTARVKGEK